MLPTRSGNTIVLLETQATLQALQHCGLHDVEEAALANVDDLSGAGLGPPPAHTTKQRLIETQRCDVTDPVSVINKFVVVSNHGVVDGSAVSRYLERHPPTCPVRQRQTWQSDPPVLLGPRHGKARFVG